MDFKGTLRAAVIAVVGMGLFTRCGPPSGTDAGSPDDAGGSPNDSGQSPPDSGNRPDAGPGFDAGHPDAGTSDAGSNSDAGLPGRGGVGLDGGTVDRLYFSLTGDSRPPICDLFFIGKGFDYPTANVTKLAQQMEARQTQFALDLGDHQFVCLGGLTEAQTQIGAYVTAMSNFTAPFFMSMGNHECVFALGGTLDDCGANNPSDPAYNAFMQALAPVSPKPYYAIDIQTSMGLATFVFVADDAWDSTESAWLTGVLTAADTRATYTIVAHHHPISTSNGNYPAIWAIIKAHKYALHLTAHQHLYSHDTSNDTSGRSVIVGTGGSSDETFLGYATVLQGTDGRLYFTMYDSSTDSPMDHWDVGPNQ
jgi:hypothetical protein